MSVVCAANDIDFDYLVKVLNDRIIHCKSVFTFAMNMYLVGRHRLFKCLVSHLMFAH